jgi:hypothetical protein
LSFVQRSGWIRAALIVLLAANCRAQPPAPGGGRGFPGGPPLTFDFNDHTGFTQIFDGKTLNGWDGSADLWTVEDGAIAGLSCPDKPAGTTFIIFKQAEPADFDLKLELKLESGRGNSGIQYRSRQEEPNANFGPGRGGPGRSGPGRGPGGPGFGAANNEPFAPCTGRVAPEGAPANAGFPGGGAYTKWNVKGYQFDVGPRAWGNLWEGGRFPGERGTVATAGQMVQLHPGQPNKTLMGTTAPPEDLQSVIKQDDWNQIEIIARGKTFVHVINGRVFSVTIDDDDSMRPAKGIIAIQMEGTNMKVLARNIWLRTL